MIKISIEHELLKKFVGSPTADLNVMEWFGIADCVGCLTKLALTGSHGPLHLPLGQPGWSWYS